MGRQGRLGDQFRERLKDEREGRKWSQAEVAKMLSDKGISGMYPTTIAKIEAGDRAVRIDELTGIADLFEVSVDALLGRRTGAGNDLAYTLRAVQTIACQSVQQTATIADALGDSLVDLDAFEFNGREEIENEVVRAQAALREAQDASANVAKFQLPPRSRVALRKSLVIREVRKVVVGPDAEVVKESDDEAQP
jgi:transcriptional regulator with XRE-family HTH domain